MQAEPTFRTSADDIGRFYVRNTRGDMVPLSSFVRVRSTVGPEYTVRFNLYRAVEIQGIQAPGYSSGQALDALEEVAAKTLPPDMGYSWNALSYQEKVASGGAARVLGLSLVFVFLILAALYESWSLPFSVLLSVPVAVLGAFLGMMSRHFDNNVYAQIGLVMLVGLTAKNAILIVEFAKAQLESGKSVVDAALTGAKIRLRPILMTSFAFIMGVLPLVFATGAGALGRRSVGSTIVGGMLLSTVLNLVFIPVLYVILSRLLRRGDVAAAEA
jgi:HAE1 family hydrophobic/amphiphilic exporter-1